MEEDLRRDEGKEPYQGMTAAEREDGREIVELDQATLRFERQQRGASSLVDRVQDFVQAVKDFVRGREQEEPTQEHGAER